MPVPKQLAKVIPSSNSFDFMAMPRGPAKTAALESAYRQGVHGCFLGGDDAPGWSTRIRNYCADEFRFDSPARYKRFDEVYDSLPAKEDENDGQHVYSSRAFEAHERDGVHAGDAPFSVYQDFGICVDSSGKEMETQLLAYRAMDPTFGEALKFLSAHYKYANRGYCSHGWTMSGWATEALRIGWCPATIIKVDGNNLDWDEEDEHEFTVARDWCRSGVPDWLETWTQEHFPYDRDGVSEFTGGVDSLKRLFSNGGCFHHGSYYTSGSSTPNKLTRIGGHAQTAFGGDWSERTLKFFNDQGIRYTANDFPCPQHQTWGSGWSGEVADRYWPEWWGPKPEGAWIISAKQLANGQFEGYTYLPSMRGVPGSGPQPPEPAPPITGQLHGEVMATGKVVIRGVVETGGHRYICRPVPSSATKFEFTEYVDI